MGILSWLFGNVINKYYYYNREPEKKAEIGHSSPYNNLPMVHYREGHEYNQFTMQCVHCGLEKADVELNEKYCLKYYFMPKKNRHGTYEGP